MLPRKYIFGKDCREKVFAGIKLMYDTVSATLGPHGRNVLIDHARQVVQPTKDGVTVVDEVRAVDDWEDMGCRLVREASQNTNVSAGDGTTTAIVLSYKMCEEGLQKITEKTNVIKVRRGMDRAVEVCVRKLEEIAMPITKEEQFCDVATISSQDPHIGTIVAKTFLEAGEHGSIDIQRAEEPGIFPEHTDGMSFNQGWLDQRFITQRDNSYMIEDVPVLVTDREIKYQVQLLPLMEQLAAAGTKKLLIVCDTIGGEALGMFAMNAQKRLFAGCAVKAPSYGKNRVEIMKDICAVTGATFVSEESGIRIEKIEPSHLGKAKKAIVTVDRTVIVSEDSEEAKERVTERIGFIEEQLKDAPEGSLQRQDLELRLATLTDGITVLKVGAQTEVERHEYRKRVEDAVKAVQSAKKEGVTPGGGTAYLRCIEAVDAIESKDRDEHIGVEIVKKALSFVAFRVLEVAGIEDKELIVAKVKEAKGNVGYDFETGKLTDLVKKGIVDAKKVNRVALQNAASCAKTFLTLEVAVSDVEEKKEED
jgi:chaperonin GroEL